MEAEDSHGTGAIAAAGGRWQRVDPGYAAARIAGQAFFFSLMALVMGGTGLFAGAPAEARLALTGAPLLALAGAVVHSVLLVRRLAWRLDADAIRFRSGVVWQRDVTIPFSRIQHLARRQGPLERMWGLHDLLIYTAGAASADCTIPGLRRATIDRLEATILRMLDAASTATAGAESALSTAANKDAGG